MTILFANWIHEKGLGGATVFLIDVRMGVCAQYLCGPCSRECVDRCTASVSKASGLRLVGELAGQLGRCRRELRAVSVELQRPPYGCPWPGPVP